jgi:hypothetical protein
MLPLLLLIQAAPLLAPAALARGVEAMAKGRSYSLPPVIFCTGRDALAGLVDRRRAGDLDSLPSGCFSAAATAPAARFTGFIPAYKVSGLSVREKLTRPNRHGRFTCPDPATGGSVSCTVWIVRTGFIAGMLVGADSSKTPAFIEVGYNIEVVDPQTGDLQFAPLPEGAPAPSRPAAPTSSRSVSAPRSPAGPG